MFHEQEQYAVKKVTIRLYDLTSQSKILQTVCRPNEINVHSALKHENILPLVAGLVGVKHEYYSGRFYHFHFTLKMDYDLSKILFNLTEEFGFLKHIYNHCSTHVELEKWDPAYRNIILTEILKTLGYLYNNGCISVSDICSLLTISYTTCNIMVKMRCQCKLLICICKTELQIKLGDFDSVGIVPGLSIIEATN